MLAVGDARVAVEPAGRHDDPQRGQNTCAKRSASGTLYACNSDSPCSQRKRAASTKRLVPCAALRPFRQREQWHCISVQPPAAISNATSWHKQLPRTHPGSVASRTGCATDAMSKPGG